MIGEHIVFFSKYVYFINIILVVVIIFFERKKPVYSVFWITVLVMTSYIGFLSYLLFGLSFRKKRITRKFYRRKFLTDFNSFTKSSDLIKIRDWKQMIQYLESAGKSQLTFYNHLEIFTEGKDLFSNMKRDISQAKHYIHMEYFIFNDDSLGNEFFNLLKEKARQGVEVRLILDGVGSRKISYKKIKSMRDAGIEVEVFFPSYFPFINLRVNYRTHRKLCIVDSSAGYIGGFNIGNEYLGEGPLGYWRDIHLKLGGEVLKELQKEFFFSWDFVKSHRLLGRRSQVITKGSKKNYFNESESEEKCMIQIVGSAPDYDYRLIKDAVLNIIMRAEKYIYIQTPYFIPDDILVEALRIASLSGVKIKIMIPEKPDHILVHWASLSYVGDLLSMGIKFYTYNNGFLHSKLVIADDEVVSVGSANFDYRSFYQNFEVNALIYDEEVAKKLKKVFVEDLRKSSLITKEIYDKRKLTVRLKESVSRLFSPIL